VKNKKTTLNNRLFVMDMEWDYQYYQPWSDSEWLLQELMDDNTRMEKGEEHNNKSYK